MPNFNCSSNLISADGNSTITFIGRRRYKTEPYVYTSAESEQGILPANAPGLGERSPVGYCPSLLRAWSTDNERCRLLVGAISSVPAVTDYGVAL